MGSAGPHRGYCARCVPAMSGCDPLRKTRTKPRRPEASEASRFVSARRRPSRRLTTSAYSPVAAMRAAAESSWARSRPFTGFMAPSSVERPPTTRLRRSFRDAARSLRRWPGRSASESAAGGVGYLLVRGRYSFPPSIRRGPLRIGLHTSAASLQGNQMPRPKCSGLGYTRVTLPATLQNPGPRPGSCSTVVG
jgi:hypothetical protein